MTRRPLLLAMALLLAACTDDPAGGPLGPGASPSPRPSSPVSATNLTGQWVFGESREPAAGPVVACQPPQIMNINDQGGRVSGGVSICGSTCDVRETFSGTRANGVTSLSGVFKGNSSDVPEKTTYELRFDAETQHLRGTRSGRPFWAAPLIVPTDGSCEKEDE